jgi:hypothetical protein
MYEKKADYRLPTTVEEAAEILISDLLIQHLQALSEMSDYEFDVLCAKVSPYLTDEFRLWQGNDALLESCLEACDFQDPARIILDRVKNILKNFHGFLVIT